MSGGTARRASDPEESDFHGDRNFQGRRRANSTDSFTRWIVGTVGASIIALLSVLAMRDRQSIDQQLIHVDSRVAGTEIRVTRVETDIVRIDTKQERVLTDLAELRKTLETNTEKLDRILLELRQR